MPEIIDSASVTWSESNDELSATATGRVTGVTVDDDGTIGSESDPDAITIDASGKVGIGTTSPATELDVNGTVTADGLTVGEAPADTPTSNVYATIIAPDNESSELIIGSNDTSVTSNDYIGGLAFYHTDNTAPDLANYAGIKAFASSSAGDMNLKFYTGRLAYDLNSPAMAIEKGNDIAFYEDTGSTQKFFWDASAEALGIGTTSPGATAGSITPDGGVYLGGTAAANLLDDYEEGTWTPEYEALGGAFSSVTYNSNTEGIYTKIGNVVFVQGYIATDTFSSGSGQVVISGLPFNVISTPGFADIGAGAVISYSDSWASNHPTTGSFYFNTDTCRLQVVDATGTTNINVTDMNTNTADNRIRFSGMYVSG